jgi:putative flippase GtrA
VPVDWADDPDSRVDVVPTAAADLRGMWRMRVMFWRGGGLLHQPAPARMPPPLGSQLIRFASIGVVSTMVFAALFALLAGPLGPIGADIVALGVCAVANTAANRRLTFALRGPGDRSRHYGAGLAVTLMPLALTLATLGLLGAAGVTALGPMLLALTVVNAVATAARFVLLRYWVFRT